MNHTFVTANQPDPAQEIIARMAAAYAGCQSYLDEGEVTTIFIQNNSRRIVTKPFSTVFVRPTSFRFEFRNRHREDTPWHRYIVWQDGESVLTWWSVRPGVETQPTLMRAIAQAAGISSGSSSTIPYLLMPNIIKGNGRLSYIDWKFIGEETLVNATAYKIQGNKEPYVNDGKFHENRFTLWIDTQTLLILQTFTKTEFETFETERTTTYRPQMNVTVPPDKLIFGAPP